MPATRNGRRVVRNAKVKRADGSLVGMSDFLRDCDARELRMAEELVRYRDHALTLSDDRGVAESVRTLAAERDASERMSTADARALLGVRFDRLVSAGKLKVHRGKGAHKWEVMRADVLAAKDAGTRGRNADETIAQTIAATRGAATGPRHPSDPKPGPLKFSDEHKPAQENDNRDTVSALRERRRYRRNSR